MTWKLCAVGSTHRPEAAGFFEPLAEVLVFRITPISCCVPGSFSAAHFWPRNRFRKKS
jgi:hypothetical protein